jgi:hypothetical protein
MYTRKSKVLRPFLVELQMQQNLLMTNNILSDEQHGFRKRRLCDTQIVLTIHDLAKALDSDDQIDGILLHFSKAFGFLEVGYRQRWN